MHIGKPKKNKPWAVVQDLRPFGYRVECTHRTQRAARRCVAWSRYLSVMSTDEVRAYNKRTEDPIEFEKELLRWTTDDEDERYDT